MGRLHEGNGGSQFHVLETDVGGKVIFEPENFDAIPEQLPFWLSQSLDRWFQRRPHLRVRAILPIVSKGDLVAIHAWYDQVQWPAGPYPERPPEVE